MASAAAALVLVLSFRAAGWSPLLAYLASLNLTTFALYAYDKRVAGGPKLRVPEAVLHGLAVLGGTPGAWLGQWLLRHKTLKASFRRVGLAIAVGQAALLGAWIWWR